MPAGFPAAGSTAATAAPWREDPGPGSLLEHRGAFTPSAAVNCRYSTNSISRYFGSGHSSSSTTVSSASTVSRSFCMPTTTLSR